MSERDEFEAWLTGGKPSAATERKAPYSGISGWDEYRSTHTEAMWSAWQAARATVEPAAVPVLTDEKLLDIVSDCSKGFDEYDFPLLASEVECINFARALLALGVPQSVPALSDGAIREIVNQLRDIAVEFHDAQQLRARIAHVIVPRLKSAAAPQLSTARQTYQD